MNKTQSLPEWDLTDLYGAKDSPELRADLKDAEARAYLFRQTYEGKLPDLKGSDLAVAIAAYEEISEINCRVTSFAELLQAAQTNDSAIGRLYQTLHERVNKISKETLFFLLELNAIEEVVLDAQLKDPEAARYASWVSDIRAMRPHQLDESTEKLLHEKELTGRNAWVRLFDETMANLKFNLDGNQKTLSDTLNQMLEADASKRKQAGYALAGSLREKERLFTFITNTLAKDKEIEDRWRGFDGPAKPRHLANKIEPEVVDAMVTAVRGAYASLSHRYYDLKADWMGLDNLHWWDRNAPLSQKSDRLFSWSEARDIILGSYNHFEPQMAHIARRFFDNSWIDAAPREGKNSGAFAHPTVPAIHPYILVNFYGKPRCVMTLSHELGHAVHQTLAAPKGLLLAQTPLTLAETASVFGEMLTFRSLLDAENDPLRRRILLANKVEDMLNTVVRQIAFHEFEVQVHSERKDGELSSERLGDIWIETQRASLGPVFNFDDQYRILWSYIPHFIHAPFYVYAYAFGDCLVNALYGVFKDGHPGFQAKYMEMLAQGGARGHKELLAPFGLDASNSNFWRKGLSVITDFIDELETTL